MGQWVTPTITLILGLAASFFTFLQWRTARDKLVLDLFQQRLKVYNDLNDALFPVFASGAQAATPQLQSQFLRATLEAKFFFGKEVENFLSDINRILIQLHANHGQLDFVEGDVFIRKSDIETEGMEEIGNFYVRLPDLVSDYMRMDHKLSKAILRRKQTFTKGR